MFVLEAQEGRLFKPLAFTKTYAMAAASILSITLVPVLMGYFIRGRIVPERRNPLAVISIWLYRPFLYAAWPYSTIFMALLQASWRFCRSPGWLGRSRGLAPSSCRLGMTMDGLRNKLDRIVKIPGVTNVWIQPIKDRIDMLATGIKTPVGVKISRADLDVIERIGIEVEKAVAEIPGTASAYAERPVGGRYIEVDIDRAAAARYMLSIADVQEVVQTAIGGMQISESIERLERFPINLRYPQDWRNSPERLGELPIVTQSGAQISLGAVAEIGIVDGPGMIRSENARPTGFVFIDIAGRDLGGYVAEAKSHVAATVQLPPGYSLAWSGQNEYIERVQERLIVVAPATLAIITLMLFLAFRRATEVAIILAALLVALAGGVWLNWYLGFDISVAVLVGFIALAGVAVETAIVMLLYLNIAWDKRIKLAGSELRDLDRGDIEAAVFEWATLRLRPKVMTVAVIFAGLIPIMYGNATGSEVMQRIAAPMIGGMASATLLTLFVIPAIFTIWRRLGLARTNRAKNQSPTDGDAEPAPAE
ncbi:efflux RND transporter permease subunit [Nisaea sp.]|uniref:efflux RND transporter permease subunit n=1 Tax=Nisaea sp. TaxID=2024842 RepID=UPI0032EDBF85